MCADTIKKSSYFPIFIYSFMIILGIFSGYSDNMILHTIGTTIADVFIKIFKFISMPIIILSIIVTLSSYNNDGSMPNIWRKALCYTLSTTLIAASISCLLYLIINPSNVKMVTPLVTENTESISYWNYLAAMIPTNIVTPFLENQVMAILLIGISVGIAIRFIPDPEAKKSVTNFFKGIHSIFFVMTKWIIAILPIGVYGFITSTVIQMQAGMDISGIGKYLFIVVAANCIQGLVILPLWLKINGIKPFDSLYKMAPALTVAFFSKSSAGTLPITMNTAENRLRLNPKISRFVLPLCTSLNMNGCAAFIFATVIFVMQNHGIEITLPLMAGWIIIATIAAVGNAGVPMGCFFLSASLLSSMNVPIVLLGMILPFYALIDMIETSLNVWSDSCVANVINKKHNDDNQETALEPA